MEFRQCRQKKYKIEYLFVWITKYRYQVLIRELEIELPNSQSRKPSPPFSPTWTPRLPPWNKSRDKAKDFKQAMMQKLLTRKTRLI